MSTKIKLSVIIPVRNEHMSIGVSLGLLNVFVKAPYEALVIYDDSRDTTVPAVKDIQKKISNIRLVRNDLGKGVPNAIKKGISAAKGEYICITPADDIGLIPIVNDMITLMDNGCDLVSVTRYAMNGKRYGGSLIGKSLSTIANKIFKLFSGSQFTDATTGGKMFRKDILTKIKLQANPVGWAVLFELAIKAQQAGLRLGEVPVVSVDRLYGGVSTFKPGPWCKEYLRWFWYGMTHLHKAKNRHRIMRPKINPITGKKQ